MTIKKIHELKTDPEPFNDVYLGLKKFEIRLNDRIFKVGDYIALRETQYTSKAMKKDFPLVYTGRIVFKKLNMYLAVMV